MNLVKCPYFELCNAPLCPLYNFQGIWYADEEICKNPEYSNLDVIKNQKKISKINKRHEVQGIFTYNMLNRSLIVKKGITGLKEDLLLEGIPKSEKTWIKNRKGVSEELKAKYQANLENAKTEEKGYEN
ncbi:MAG: hypothetical protein ACP5L4_06905 [Thermoplasmata archaeon]